MRMVKRLRKDFLILIIGCFLALSFDVYSEVIIIAPSENSQERLQEALILAEPGDIVQLTSGIYELEDSLSLDIDSVTIQGNGHEETILDFSCLLYTSPSPRD